MKKSLLLLLLVASTGILRAYDFQVDGICYNILTDQTNAVEVTYELYLNHSNYSNLRNIVIPDTITYQDTTYSVASIGKYAFGWSNNLTSVTIPNSVTSIGASAFSICRGLTSITIPNSVTSIGEKAFYDCQALISVTIPDSVTSIEDETFYSCSSLTSITIPNSVTSIGNKAFANCSGLTSIIVAAGNTMYDSRNNCNAIIETASNTLIAGCKGTIIPNNVTTIGNSAFNYCRSLTTITIPNSVTSIGNSAFIGCSGLTSVTIPNSVTNIGEGAFFNCTDLASVAIGDSVTSIRNQTFESCSSLNSVIIGNSVTSIGERAFRDCNSLTSITIPNSVTSIGEWAFSYCSGLTSITIPNSVISIEDGAFHGCSDLTFVTIGNSLTSIGSAVFMECRALRSITIPHSVTSIGGSAFESCSSLDSVIIGNSVTSIGNRAFFFCRKLYSITCETVTPPALGDDVFYGVTKSIPLYVPANSIALYQSADQWEDFTNMRAILETLRIDSAVCESDLPITWHDKSIPYAGIYYDTLQAVEGYDSVIFVLNLTVYPTYLFEENVTVQENNLPYQWQGRNLTEAGNYVAEYETIHGCDSIYTLQLTVKSIVYCSVTLEADHGYVEGTGIYPVGMQITLTAVPDDGFEFHMWSDGTTNNPKEFIIRQDTTIRAHFYMPAVEQEVTVDSIEPHSVTIVWDTVPGAVLYELRIYKNGHLVVTYEIDANNTILNETFNGPDRLIARRDSTGGSSETLQVDISGLESGQEYTYSLDALDDNRNFVGAQSGSFTTGEEPSNRLDTLFDDRRTAPRKVLRNGCLYIELPDGTGYSVLGQRVARPVDQ